MIQYDRMTKVYGFVLLLQNETIFAVSGFKKRVVYYRLNTQSQDSTVSLFKQQPPAISQPGRHRGQEPDWEQ